MHRFPHTTTSGLPSQFTDPFRYAPHPLVRTAAGIVMEMMDRINPEGEGKMLGVLVVRDSNGELGFLAGFSGNIAGRSTIEGFVPPIYDLLKPDGEFKKREAGISRMNEMISALEKSPVLAQLQQEAEEIRLLMETDLAEMKKEMAKAKEKRIALRAKTDDPQILKELEKQSQFAKAELRRRKKEWSAKLEETVTSIRRHITEINAMKNSRASESDSLQKWIFDRYIIMNAAGTEASINEIFRHKDLIAPGGTGECAAPKLLNYAFRNGYQPLAMGEFWYGHPSPAAVRTHGHFYPSCTSKCGPLLEFMLKGIEYGEPDMIHGAPEIIHEDQDLVIISKPSGMPSVRGLDGKESIVEWLNRKYMNINHIAVHRLDMDTSGVMVYARNRNTAGLLQRQFEEHSISKTYLARLSPSDKLHKHGFTRPSELMPKSKGCISCPLSPDYDERPRQMIDLRNGKASETLYEVVRNNDDGTTDIIFYPMTGRTHQLRVHAAHPKGLARPIAGDLLYGGDVCERLMLHAFRISFLHPGLGHQVTYESMINCFKQ